MQTPKKQGDDGWKSTLYEGRPLENYRRKYLQESGLDTDAPEVSRDCATANWLTVRAAL